jgi:hypothetical protein
VCGARGKNKAVERKVEIEGERKIKRRKVKTQKVRQKLKVKSKGKQRTKLFNWVGERGGMGLNLHSIFFCFCILSKARFLRGVGRKVLLFVFNKKLKNRHFTCFGVSEWVASAVSEGL